MSKLLLSGVAVVVLTTALAGCASKRDRALGWCRDNFSGYTQMECEHQMRQRYRR